MTLFRDLSYRYRIPLAITAVIVATECMVTMTLLSQGLADARRDLQAGAENLVAVLSRSLREPLLRDDVWQAFEVIRTPIETRDENNALESITVTDNGERVLISTDTKTFPMLASIDSLPESARKFLKSASAAKGFSFTGAKWMGAENVVASGDVLSDDGSSLGRVVIQYDGEKISQRIRTTLIHLFAVTLPGLVVLILLGWFWGKRMVAPLSRLAADMQRIGKVPPMEIAKEVTPAGKDEIGVLSASFKDMLHGLDEKERLEQEMVTAERLAAVGRVSTGIAHEINNPLGGMLNAVDTLATHGNPDAFTKKTLGLLERGLNQIRTTVGALLVEARLDSPAMTRADWQDLETLITPQVHERAGALVWDVTIGQPIPLPSHLVRQLVLNLLLNAVKAVRDGGHIWFEARIEGATLEMAVANDGDPIPPERMGHLFEPYTVTQHGSEKKSYPIGLWVCYQVVKTLGGTIHVVSADGLTRFQVSVPLSGGKS
ncbi:sensor histidine kinase [Cupriavidus basilensis]|uniref:sensor histidine kinase n=1 Tax=Cupriavidus basilensis TaxID=68895 RepID=UPI0023E84C83|nr:HAMP domain-containing sensor histidine kinase [Cupriavidus basilensis]MDF3888343.1 HAMP domain-containing sensor histidine kinase [Cupriavidus basilensis]